MAERTRAEHMAWCKQRAIECLPDIDEAMASMLSDLGKHDETRGHIAGEMMLSMRVAGHLGSPEKMREFINGFN